jgi:hypothetical protein
MLGLVNSIYCETRLALCVYCHQHDYFDLLLQIIKNEAITKHRNQVVREIIESCKKISGCITTAVQDFRPEGRYTLRNSLNKLSRATELHPLIGTEYKIRKECDKCKGTIKEVEAAEQAREQEAINSDFQKALVSFRDMLKEFVRVHNLM